MRLFLIILITIIPIALWAVYFYVKNPRKQPISEIVKIFLIGMLSIVPVLIFHKFYLDRAVNYIVGLLNLTEVSILLSLIELGLMAIFIVFFILVFALINSITIHLKLKLPWGETFSKISKKMYSLTPILIFFALFLVLELVFNFAFQIDFILSLAGSTVILAVLEEYLKYIINPFLIFKRQTSLGSAMVSTLYVGLAFAFVENILFFINSFETEGFTLIFIYRSFFTTLLHVCASGVLGYFYGLSIFSNSILAEYEIEKSQYSAFAPLRKLLKFQKKSIFQNIQITQGFFVAGLVHALFNYLLYLDLKIISAILIVVFSLFIVYLLNLRTTQKQYGLVGTATMPEQDFESLRLQISVAQHLKEIQSQKPSTTPQA